MSFTRTRRTAPAAVADAPRSRGRSRLRALPQRRRRRRLLGWTAAVVATVLSATGAVALAPAANAATKGPGFGTWAATSAYGWHGAMMIDGVATYCISPGLPAPVGSSTDAGVTGAVADLSAAQLTRINLLVSRYGQTTDDVRAAAVAWSVKAIANWDVALHEFGYPGNTLAGAINWTFSSLSPANNVAIQRLATSYYDEAMATPAGTTSGTGALAFTTDPVDHSRGTVRAAAPAGSRGTIQLTNARFADNGTNTLTGAVAGTSYAITGAPPTDDGASYRVSGTGRFATGYAPAVHLFRTAGQQNTAGPGGSSSFTVSGKDGSPRTVTFLPVLTSRTAKTTPDGHLSDTLTFATAPDKAGVQNAWFRRSDGTPVDVHFTVTAYGPFDTAPAETPGVPSGARVAEVVPVSTGSTGDTAPMTATFRKLHPGGVYTFVAAYDPETTPTTSRAFLPHGYAWKHAFGMETETTLVPMKLALSSKIAAARTRLGGTDDDTVTVKHEGAWLKDAAGAPIPVVLHGEYVHLPSGSSTSPTDELPAGATMLGEVSLTVTKDGDYRASTGGALPRNPVSPASAPAKDAGRTTWRWAVRTADQAPEYRDRITESAEQYGVESQTAAVALPTVTTKAQAGYSATGSVQDTALVRGALPADGADLSFSAYTVPMRQDTSGAWVVDAPSGATDDDLSWVCTKENLLFSDAGHGRRILKAGDYTSPAIQRPPHAKLLWVETLTTVPSPGTPARPIRTGECGEPTETSYGVDVTTQAQSGAEGTAARPGGDVFDTAEAIGYVPEGGAISFRVYAWPSDSAPTCTASTLQTTLSATSGPLAGGLYREGAPLTVESRRWKPPAELTGSTVGFVEVLTDRDGRVVHTGACGAENEMLTIAGPSADTGGMAPASDASRQAPLVLGLVALLGAGVVAAGGGAAFAARSRARGSAAR